MKNRIAKVDAACKIKNDSGSMQKTELKQCVGILKGDLASIPVDLRLSIVSQCIVWEIKSFTAGASTHFTDNSVETKGKIYALLDRLNFWQHDLATHDPDDLQAGIDFEAPSLLALVAEIITLNDASDGAFAWEIEDKDKSKDIASRWEAGFGLDLI